MTLEEKQESLSLLRDSFILFMNQIMKTQGSPNQMQQAFIRFDEGHMWMQNAIITYEEPKAE